MCVDAPVRPVGQQEEAAESGDREHDKDSKTNQLKRTEARQGKAMKGDKMVKMALKK